MFFSSLLEIPRRSGLCSHCAEKFPQGSFYHSALTIEKKQNLKRQDYCSDCWKHLEPSIILSFQCHWKAATPDKKENDQRFLCKEAYVLSLVKDRTESQNHEELVKRFFLALYLVRKRILVQRKELEISKEIYILFEIVETEEIIPIKKIQPEKIDLNKIQLEIAEMLACYQQFQPRNSP